MHARKHYVWASLFQDAVRTCCALCKSVKKGLCKVTGEKTMKAKDGDTDKEAQVERGSLVSLFVIRCAGVSAFCFPIVGVLGLTAVTTMHCTVHHHVHTRALAWHGLTWRAQRGARPTYPYHVNIVSRSVGRSVDARVPIDHASVGFAQARSSYIQV